MKPIIHYYLHEDDAISDAFVVLVSSFVLILVCGFLLSLMDTITLSPEAALKGEIKTRQQVAQTKAAHSLKERLQRIETEIAEMKKEVDK